MSKVISASFGEKIRTFFFELYGDVEGEKGEALNEYIRDLAEKFDLKGFCNLTRDGSVEGYLEGEIGMLDKFKNFLLPGDCTAAKIDQAVFGFEDPIAEYSEDTFMVREENENPCSSRIYTDYTPIFDDPLES